MRKLEDGKGGDGADGGRLSYGCVGADFGKDA